MDENLVLDANVAPRTGVFIVGSLPLAGMFLVLAASYGPRDPGFWPFLVLGTALGASAVYLHRRFTKRRPRPSDS